MNFRVTTEPFQRMGVSYPLSPYIPSLNAPNMLGAEDDRFLYVFQHHNTSSVFIVTTKAVVHFVGANCNSSIPIWLWILIISFSKNFYFFRGS